MNRSLSPHAGLPPSAAPLARRNQERPPGEDPPEHMVDRLGLLAPALDAWIDQISELVEQAEALDQIRDDLLELYPSTSLDDYAAAMAEALAAALLVGVMSC